MNPVEMIAAGIRALRNGEAGHLSREAAAHTAMAWAALAEATKRVQAPTPHVHVWTESPPEANRAPGRMHCLLCREPKEGA